MLSHLDSMRYVGLSGWYYVKGMKVGVSVTDARIRFGILDFYITPINGEGSIWVEASNIAIKTSTGYVWGDEWDDYNHGKVKT